jgi:hypothetical protein
MIKVTKPEDISNPSKQAYEKAINDFEEQFRKEEKGQKYYHLVITGELHRSVSDKVESTYSKAGWFRVKCRTSSENGERAGLTGLYLYLYPND